MATSTTKQNLLILWVLAFFGLYAAYNIFSLAAFIGQAQTSVLGLAATSLEVTGIYWLYEKLTKRKV